METKQELVYRCRMCGETFASYSIADHIRISRIHEYLIRAEFAGLHLTDGETIPRYATHVHADDTEGFADYVGYREVRDGK